MIPADDAHCTVELEDRYVILQSFANAARDAYLHRGGTAVPEGFSYSSDSNPEKLDGRGLQLLLADGLCLTAPLFEDERVIPVSALRQAGDRRRRHQGGGRGPGVRLADHRTARFRV